MDDKLIGYKDGMGVYVSDALLAQKGEREVRYWLCCGSTTPKHGAESCHEAQTGHPERVRFGTAKEHSDWQKNESSNPALKEKAVQVLSKSLTLYVPVQHRRTALQAIDGFIAAAGGCTSRFVEGYWQGAGGRLVEDVNEITVFYVPSQAPAVYAAAAKAALALLSAGEQAVLIAEGKDTALYSAEDLPQLQQLVKDAQ